MGSASNFIVASISRNAITMPLNTQPIVRPRPLACASVAIVVSRCRSRRARPGRSENDLDTVSLLARRRLPLVQKRQLPLFACDPRGREPDQPLERAGQMRLVEEAGLCHG